MQSQPIVQPTILRIKRKRTDEPLDALVIESKSRRKKSRGFSGLFQFAETVDEEGFWQDPSQTKELKTRITSLASGEFIPEKADHDVLPAHKTPTLRYTIVKKEQDKQSPASPIVKTTRKGKIPIIEDLNMFDAIPESGSSSKGPEPMDPEMANFLPMLQEYLRMNDEPANITSSSSSLPRDEEEEYVWDVFYHRPAITGWAAIANVATVSGLPPIGDYDSGSDSDSAGDSEDEDSNTEDFYRNDYPDEDPDLGSDDSHHLSASEEEFPEVSDEAEDKDFDAFLAWRRGRGRGRR